MPAAAGSAAAANNHLNSSRTSLYSDMQEPTAHKHSHPAVDLAIDLAGISAARVLGV